MTCPQIPRLDHDRVHHVSLSKITPAPENDDLYRPVDIDDAEIIGLADSIEQYGLREPIVLSADGFILSGHRRYAACEIAGLNEIPVRYDSVSREDDPDEFVRLLREYNRQRVKTSAERLREEIVAADPDLAYDALIEHREKASAVSTAPIVMRGKKGRCAISKAKQPFLEAIQRVLSERQKFWPLSDRAIHYGLLNDPPLRHASKPKSIYENTAKSYNSLVDLLTRARLEGAIPWQAIEDSTRPISIWKVHQETGTFVRTELSGMFGNYWRDLMQSQPNHIEIVLEKNTLGGVIRPVASRYTIPLTIGRGYCSLPPRREMSERFKKSGKEKLVLLMLSDFDPDGEEIAHSFARSMRDDFGIENVHPIKVTLTEEQVKEHDLPPIMTAKKTSSRCKEFVEQFGDTVHELEALSPETLQELLGQAIDSVLDIDAFNAEIDAEKKDAAFLSGIRETVQSVLRELDWEDEAS